MVGLCLLPSGNVHSGGAGNSGPFPGLAVGNKGMGTPDTQGSSLMLKCVKGFSYHSCLRVVARGAHTYTSCKQTIDIFFLSWLEVQLIYPEYPTFIVEATWSTIGEYATGLWRTHWIFHLRVELLVATPMPAVCEERTHPSSFLAQSTAGCWLAGC